MSYTSKTPASISKGAQILSIMFQRVYLLTLVFFSSIVNMLTSFGIFCPYLPSLPVYSDSAYQLGEQGKWTKSGCEYGFSMASSVPQFGGLSAILPKDLEPKIKRSDKK